MALANDSILVTPGSGATVATHLVASKEHQVIIQADSDGNLVGSLPTYQWIVPSTAVGANKLYLDLFNASGSGKVLKIHAIAPVVDTDVAVVGALGIRIVLMKTSTVGTGGTAWVTDGGMDVAGGALSTLDSDNPAVPAQVTGRHLLTGGGTESAWLRGAYLMGEESATSMAYNFQGQFNMAAVEEGTQKLTLREGQGIKIKQGAIAATGNVRFRLVFTLE